MRKRDYKEGFTIIEVALVFAIAGLIFLMVFIALPAVQKTQRDAERRDDLGALVTAIQKYQNNSRGALPSTSSAVGSTINYITIASLDNYESGSWEDFYMNYLGDNFTDPIAGNYNLVIENCSPTNGSGSSCGASANSIGDTNFTINDNGNPIYVVIGATCDGAIAIASNNSRKVAVLYKLEGAGAYCTNSQ